MVEIKPSRIARIAAEIALGCASVAVITAVCFAAHIGFAIPCLLYLVIVVAQSQWGAFVSSAVVSLVAAVCLDYFFIPPILHWQIYDPEYTVALLTYWVTSLVITRLASRARNEARVAERRRRDATLLYDVASRLLSLAPEHAAGPESLRIFREVFGLRAVCFLDSGSDKLRMEGNSDCGLAWKIRDACAHGVDYRSRDGELHIRCLRAGGEMAGAVGFEGRFDDEAVALALSLLAATAVERMRAFGRASESAANAQAEMLRSAILDAFAHEFKTPLAIILAAAGGLRETMSGQGDASFTPAQIEMTDIIENQTVRLSHLTTRLLRTARLDRNNVTPSMELTSLNSLVRSVVEQHQNLFGRRITGTPARETAEVMADPELLGLAVNQLLDNACKYSPPDGAVLVELESEDGWAGIRVSNEGVPIRTEEEEQIFDRFFRGAGTEHGAPGAGLGLFVARKIVRAHGGYLTLERNPDRPAITTFHISLPVIQHASEHEQKTNQGVGSGR